jgi:hypothetical protein
LQVAGAEASFRERKVALAEMQVCVQPFRVLSACIAVFILSIAILCAVFTMDACDVCVTIAGVSERTWGGASSIKEATIVPLRLLACFAGCR